MKQLHLNNHYVPKFYLKRWSKDKKNISMYRTIVGHSSVLIWSRYNISNIAYQKNLYTHFTNGKETDELEEWLNKEFESPASRVIDKALKEESLNSHDWEVLIKFLAATRCKNTKTIKRTSRAFQIKARISSRSH